jgi:hypothetical protein
MITLPFLAGDLRKNLPLLMKLGIVRILLSEISGEWRSKRRLMICKIERYRMLIVKECLRTGDAFNGN